MTIKVKFAGKVRTVSVVYKDCATRKCFHPHDCPVQGSGGVRESQERWMCLTNVLRGCPESEIEHE
jgi:hypothetical protein